MSFFRFFVSKTFLINLLIFFGVCLVLLWGTHQGLLIFTRHNQRIKLPDFSKQPFEKVIQKIDDMGLRYELIDSLTYLPNYPKKSVVYQEPQAGNFVKKGRKIYFTLNPSSYENIQIPFFYGRTFTEVSANLRELGFEIGEKISIPDLGKNVVRKLRYDSIFIEKDDVLPQLPKRSVIDIFYGSGKP